MSSNTDRVARALLAVGTILLVAIIVINLWFVAASRTGQLSDRIMQIEDQLTYISCLMLIGDGERTPEAVASCQVARDG